MNAAVNILKSLFPDCCHNRVLLIGGTVRDMLLCRESQDIDLLTALSHEELLGLGFRLVEPKSSAAIYFRYHPGFGKIEATRISSLDELRADLRGRDFTINAMAMALSGEKIDPLGGEEDLQAGLLRACSKESFKSDPLRVFRAFRFEAEGWRMTSETETLIREGDWSESFSVIPVERFSGEMVKALARKEPERFFGRMLELNAGAEFLPELFRMPQIPAGPPEHHPEGDLFTHSTQVLQRITTLTADPLARFCAFFHDLGKLATDQSLYPKHHGHDDAGFAMAEAFCKRLCLPAAYRKALAWVCRLHGKANKWLELRLSTRIKIAQQSIKAGIVDILPLVSGSDKPGSMPQAGWGDAVRVAGMNTLELGIDPERLAAMPVGSRPAFILQKRVEAFRG